MPEQETTHETNGEASQDIEEKDHEPYHDLLDDAKLQWITDIREDLVDPIAFEMTITALRTGKIKKPDFTDHYIQCVLRLRTAVQGKRTQTVADAMKNRKEQQDFSFFNPFPVKETAVQNDQKPKKRGLFGR